MDKIGLKFFKAIDYELFEPLQYWLDYHYEYEDFLESIKNDEVIELQLEEDEDRAEDIEMLQAFLEKISKEEVSYELFVMHDEWKMEKLINII
ncbi:MAG: Unknown protein [uncultured Sulfurovum sp.]|uniref:Uncharacterized protein n=1 Tax=uncultured Sulfurovum sp. TaxID=269237 RepID=A0A6S6SEB7_9BACT|nr:MAG: Unknown protein [uncultured Sulfurovum sp.]